ncbi:MAG: hypothetical protein IR153_03220 [Flavobacterium sp.]|nr:hypothetical protein [Flavobacterium sp.]
MRYLFLLLLSSIAVAQTPAKPKFQMSVPFNAPSVDTTSLSLKSASQPTSIRKIDPLPKNYDWQRDFNINDSYKRAGLEYPYTHSIFVNRLPDAFRDANFDLLYKSMPPR